MSTPLALLSIPEKDYDDYRYEVIFGAYKWDPQVNDHNTVSRHVLLLDEETAWQLGQWAEQLARETVEMEGALARKLPLAKELGLPRETVRALKKLAGYNPEHHVRLMRFDFHPTTDGWAVSEVNSDVPGGFAEASALPEIAGRYFAGHTPGVNAANSLAAAFEAKVRPGGTIAFVHCTSYADDRQVMQCLGDSFAAKGYKIIYTAPDHVRWAGKRAVSVLEGCEGGIDGIVRFFPLEWLANLPRQSHWEGYFDCETTSCNHPIAMFAQSKRLPLVWERLGVESRVWEKLLPETEAPKKSRPRESWLYKPALGRVGEGISVKSAISEKELRQIEKAARKSPQDWVAQRMFQSRPLQTQKGEIFHLCVGVFTIEGDFAGFYGRISPYPRIDANAKDIPVLVQKRGEEP